MLNIYGKSVTRKFLSAFFWVPIPFKRYQNTSGCSTDTNSIVDILGNTF